MYYHHHTRTDFGQSISSTSLWPVILSLAVALAVAFATAFFAHYFYEKRKKRGQIVSAAAQLISASRQLKRNHLGYAENNSYYSDLKLRGITSMSKLDGGHDAEALAALNRAEGYQKDILLTQKEVDEAYYLLIGLSATVRTTKLMKATKSIVEFKIQSGQSLSDTKKAISGKFKQPLNDIEEVCITLIFQNANSWIERRRSLG